MIKPTLFLSLLLILQNMFAQQVGDTAFSYPIMDPAYPSGQGPMIWIDEAHHNFHTLDWRFQPFARLVRSDGYQVNANDRPFHKAALSQCRIMVIANALHESNLDSWSLPNPSAFSTAEIAALQRWVASGGSLLLLADHMPFPGAASELAKAFGFTFYNGFAKRKMGSGVPDMFYLHKENLQEHAITEGIDSVGSFMGQAFRPPLEADPLISFSGDYEIVLPRHAWQFTQDVARMDIAGWSQGAVRAFGQGRVAVFGEAAMFTAQLAGEAQAPMGMNSPKVAQNAPFLLNVIHWLDDREGWQVPNHIVKRIKVLNHGMEEAMRAKDMIGVAGFYADSGIVKGAGGSLHRGRKELDAYWENFEGLDWRLDIHVLAESMEALKASALWQRMDNPPPEWQEDVPAHQLEGAIYQLGTSTLKHRGSDGQTHIGTCDFVLVWIPQGPNSYRILVDSYSCRD